MKKNNKNTIITVITASLLLLATGCSQAAETVDIIVTDTTSDSSVTTVNTEAETSAATAARTTAAQTTTAVQTTTTVTTVPDTEAQPVTVQTEAAPAPVITTTTTAAPVITTTTTTVTTVVTTITQSNDSNSKYNQALEIAKEAVNAVRELTGTEKSLYQIEVATSMVANYVTNNVVYSDTDPDDWTAYGVFIAHRASCQGAADALGMVLTELGYQWEHINKNLYTHQWLKVYYNYSATIGRAEGYGINGLSDLKLIEPLVTATVSGSYVYADGSRYNGWIGIGSFKDGFDTSPVLYEGKDGWILYYENFNSSVNGTIPYYYGNFDIAYDN